MTYPCPECRQPARVARTETTPDYVRRRHKCECGNKFGTIQILLKNHERVTRPAQPTENKP